jgi:hypothetical protein
MGKGHVLTIGRGKSNNLLLLKDLQSYFCSHSFAFGDETQKKLLTTNINEITGNSDITA